MKGEIKVQRGKRRSKTLDEVEIMTCYKTLWRLCCKSVNYTQILLFWSIFLSKFVYTLWTKNYKMYEMFFQSTCFLHAWVTRSPCDTSFSTDWDRLKFWQGSQFRFFFRERWWLIDHSPSTQTFELGILISTGGKIILNLVKCSGLAAKTL